MPESNQHRPLSFSNDWIESVLVGAVRDMPVEDAIVVNLSTTAARTTRPEEITEPFSLEIRDAAALHTSER